MAIQADMITERRKLKRRLGLWRFLAVVLALAIAGFALFAAADTTGNLSFRDHIARITVDGIITDDTKQQDLLRQVARSTHAKALILRINSPGGTTTGSEALFAAIRAVTEKKPVVAVLGTVAASGGYVAALAADRIIARGNTITGSIGVILQWAEVSELLSTLGIKVEEVKSGALKGQPSFTAPTTAAGRAAARGMVLDSYEWFVGLVRERRKMPDAKAREVSDGRVFTGGQAVTEKLVDAIGGEPEAQNWLASEHKIDKDLEIRDWRSESYESIGLTKLIVRAVVAGLGLGDAGVLGVLSEKTLRSKRLSLDGLVSVWHP